MPFPQTFDQMQAAGYKLDNHANCKACQADIEWWITPRGKKIPMNLMPKGDSPAVAHFSTCPNADQFRKEKTDGNRN